LIALAFGVVAWVLFLALDNQNIGIFVELVGLALVAGSKRIQRPLAGPDSVSPHGFSRMPANLHPAPCKQEMCFSIGYRP